MHRTANYSQNLYFANTARPQGADISFDITELNTSWQYSPALQFGFAYIFSDAHPDGESSTRLH